MKISFFFAWYVFWIGAFYDRKKYTWYICPLPCCVIKIEPKPLVEPDVLADIRWANEQMALICATQGHDYRHVATEIICINCGKKP